MDTGEMYTDDDDDDESPSEDGEPSIDADEIFTDNDDDSPSADGEPSMSPSGDGGADCSQIQGKELSTRSVFKVSTAILFKIIISLNRIAARLYYGKNIRMMVTCAVIFVFETAAAKRRD
ncbi:unnamed protein product [Prunus brigantina]